MNVEAYLVWHQFVDDILGEGGQSNQDFRLDLFNSAVFQQTPASLRHILLLAEHRAVGKLQTKQLPTKQLRCDSLLCAKTIYRSTPDL